MRKYYSVPAGFIVLTAIAFLCTSYIPSIHSTSSSTPDKGHYNIVVKGEHPVYLNGIVDFDAHSTVSGNGETYTKWNIRLRDHEGYNRHFLDFYLVNTLSSDVLEKGSYRISENIESLLTEFRGVFGFADIDQCGELPYFSRKGRITILNAGEESLTGSLELELRNAAGRIIEVEGNFSALKDHPGY